MKARCLSRYYPVQNAPKLILCFRSTFAIASTDAVYHIDTFWVGPLPCGRGTVPFNSIIAVPYTKCAKINHILEVPLILP